MKVEIRTDGLHIVGYVNVPGRESKPVLTSRGKVIEVIEQRAFERAIERADNINIKLDHDRIIGSTKQGNLTVYEDAVGLRAETIINDAEVIEGARQGKLKGWSFDMMNIKDTIEERADKLPLRHVKDFTMSEITLAMNKTPVYSSTSIELRGGEETQVEIRTSDDEISLKDLSIVKENKQNLSQYQNRINKLKVGK